MNTRAVILAVLLSALISACSDMGSSWTGTMYDSAGVTIVSNPGTPLWAPGEEWTLEEDLRIGVVEGDPNYQFGRVGPIAVDSNGRILVFDGLASHIQVYSPEGVHELTIGRRGEGPGELMGADALLLGPADTLLVPSLRIQRFTRFTPDGSSAGTSRLAVQEGYPWRYRSTASGVMVAQMSPMAATPSDVVEDPQDAIVLLATDGAVTDTLLTFPVRTMAGPGANAGQCFFCPQQLWYLTDDLQLLFGVSDEYRIGIYADGQLERIVTIQAEPRPVSNEEIQAVLRSNEEEWAEAGLPEALKERFRNRNRFGEVHPLFDRIAAGPMGTIWVRHEQVASTPNGEQLWDVFDSAGRFMGVITMTDRFEPRVFRANKIYGVWRDEVDVEYLVRLRIVTDHVAGVL